MGTISCLVNNILQNNLFCFERKKEIHIGLENLESEQMMTEFSFLDELFIKESWKNVSVSTHTHTHTHTK